MNTDFGLGTCRSERLCRAAFFLHLCQQSGGSQSQAIAPGLSYAHFYHFPMPASGATLSQRRGSTSGNKGFILGVALEELIKFFSRALRDHCGWGFLPDGSCAQCLSIYIHGRAIQIYGIYVRIHIYIYMVIYTCTCSSYICIYTYI